MDLTARRIAWSLATVFLVYAVAMSPFPGVGRLYTPWFRAICSTFDGPVGANGLVHLLPPGDDSLRDVEFALRKRDSLSGVKKSISSRYSGYVPTVIVIALVLATPVAWKRRRWALFWGLLLSQVFVWFRVGLSVYGLFVTRDAIRLVSPGPFLTETVRFVMRLVASSSVFSIVAALLIWILVTFRREDLATPDRPQ